MQTSLIYSKKAQQRGGFISTLIKIVIGLALLYVAYLLFQYAAAKGDWDFIINPLKSLFGSI
ncbi:MAG: hypothetical protein KAS15_08000 [Nanoarchaeota archaeon]|nr:hypothetical protein [Nanoarchaeota archaeon]